MVKVNEQKVVKLAKEGVKQPNKVVKLTKKALKLVI